MTATADDIARAVQAQRALAERLFDTLRRDSLDEPGVTRDPYGAGEQRAHATVIESARALGLEIDHDAAANAYMTWPGADRSLPRVITGSHLDSVPHGGNFDGAAGVVAGLVAVAALRSLGVTPNRDLTVMAIRAEESIWFQVSYLGSRGALGTLPPGAMDAVRRDTGRTLASHVEECGGRPEALRAGEAHLDPRAVAAFVELHIEQAPSLIEQGRPVAVCTGIPGNVRYPAARIEGSHDHVGMPRRFRRDAALAGAEFALALEQLWAEHDAREIPMACTLGRFHTDAGAHGLTIVPGLFHFSLDLRAYDSAILAALEERVLAIAAGIAQRRGVQFVLGERAGAAVGVVDPAIRAGLLRAAASLSVPVLEIGSPASHDAAAFAAAGVPVGMLFVRNANGSHNPREAMEIADFLSGCAVLTCWLAQAVSGRVTQ
jgi:N-carbamoyl-L-amino-acid hydrolase